MWAKMNGWTIRDVMTDVGVVDGIDLTDDVKVLEGLACCYQDSQLVRDILVLMDTERATAWSESK